MYLHPFRVLQARYSMDSMEARENHVMFNCIYPSSVCNLTSSIEIDGKKMNFIENTAVRHVAERIEKRASLYLQ